MRVHCASGTTVEQQKLMLAGDDGSLAMLERQSEEAQNELQQAQKDLQTLYNKTEMRNRAWHQDRLAEVNAKNALRNNRVDSTDSRRVLKEENLVDANSHFKRKKTRTKDLWRTGTKPTEASEAQSGTFFRPRLRGGSVASVLGCGPFGSARSQQQKRN